MSVDGIDTMFCQMSRVEARKGVLNLPHIVKVSRLLKLRFGMMKWASGLGLSLTSDVMTIIHSW